MTTTKVGSGQVLAKHLDKNGHMNMVYYADIVNISVESLVSYMNRDRITEVDLLYFVRKANFHFVGELLLGENWLIELSGQKIDSFGMSLVFTLRVESKVKFRAIIQLVTILSTDRKIYSDTGASEYDFSKIQPFQYMEYGD
jgi:acyl-CoA thioesterase FadM